MVEDDATTITHHSGNVFVDTDPRTEGEVVCVGIIPDRVFKVMSERPFQLLELCRQLPEGGFLWQPHRAVRSIRDILAHMMGAERFWIEHVVEGGAKPTVDETSFTTTDGVERSFRPVRERTVAWLDSLRESARSETRHIGWAPHEVTLESVAWHLIIHDFHHKRQVATRLATLGVEVPNLDML
ncbi:MAG: DinB family protein [Limnochordales bacterium]|nr:DinB family protein [Limnochordales bacterium]